MSDEMKPGVWLRDGDLLYLLHETASRYGGTYLENRHWVVVKSHSRVDAAEREATVQMFARAPDLLAENERLRARLATEEAVAAENARLMTLWQEREAKEREKREAAERERDRLEAQVKLSMESTAFAERSLEEARRELGERTRDFDEWVRTLPVLDETALIASAEAPAPRVDEPPEACPTCGSEMWCSHDRATSPREGSE